MLSVVEHAERIPRAMIIEEQRSKEVLINGYHYQMGMMSTIVGLLRDSQLGKHILHLVEEPLVVLNRRSLNLG